MPTLLQIVHGYPPRENAGTEQYAHRLSMELRRRGWRVEVLAATRDLGHPQGTLLREDGVWRLVNNMPWRPLSAAEADPRAEEVVRRAIAELRPDLVHIQHLLFLSARLEMPIPSVITLHDAWAWCPRGGTLLRGGEAPCPGPDPGACPACYADFARSAPLEHGLARLAGRRVEAAHRLWRRLPARVRALPAALPHRAPDPRDLEPRQRSVADAFRRPSLRMAPSRWLAEEAERRLGVPVLHVPHGVEAGLPRVGGGPLVFIGTLARHKGPDLVAEAWNRLGPDRPPLRIFGPSNEALALPAELLGGALDPEGVRRTLAGARALVLGSRWPENAPLVVLEARAAGCPVVAPSIGGLPELVEEGVDGCLYRPGDAEDLARALRLVCARDWPSVRPPPTFAEHVDRLESLYRGAMLPAPER